MGEYANYILEGDDCQECGEHIGPGEGFPRSCMSCQTATRRAKNESKGHKCFNPRCTIQVQNHLYSCPGHWEQLPKEIKILISKGYRKRDQKWKDGHARAQKYWNNPQ